MVEVILDDQARLVLAEAAIVEVRSDVSEIRADIKDIKATLLGRPSWAITFVLTFLTSMVVGLSVALAAIPR